MSEQTSTTFNATELLASLHKQAADEKYLEKDDQVYFDASKVNDLSIRVRILIERAIIRKLVGSVLARTDRQYSITVYDGEESPVIRSRSIGTIMAEIGACDEEAISFYDGTVSGSKRIGYANLIYGNDGWDVIADSTADDATQELLAEAELFADAICEALN